eukprot:535627-Rhodomonas_salina.1
MVLPRFSALVLFQVFVNFYRCFTETNFNGRSQRYVPAPGLPGTKHPGTQVSGGQESERQRLTQMLCAEDWKSGAHSMPCCHTGPQCQCQCIEA